MKFDLSLTLSHMEQPPQKQSDRPERMFSTCVWLAMSVALIGYVVVYGRNVPYYEDWLIVPVITGQEPLRWSWFTEQLIEHRYVLAKVILYLIWQVSAGDFRIGMFCIVLILIGISYALMRCARRLRGRASFADAFFPMVFLTWGAQENIIFFSQLYYVFPVLLVTLLLTAIAGQWWERGGAWRPWVLGIAVALLPLNGAIGLAYLSCLLPWTAGLALTSWRKGGDARRQALAFAVTAAAAALFVCLYFVGYQTPDFGSREPRTAMSLAGSLKSLLSVTFGPAGGHFTVAVSLGIIALYGASALLLLNAFRTASEDRARASGLLSVLGSTAVLAAAIAWGRTGLGVGAVYAFRYALLIMPGICCAWFAWSLYGKPAAARVLDFCLFTIACLMLIPNITTGIGYGEWRGKIADTLASDVREGLPANLIAERNVPYSFPHPQDLERGLKALEATGAGPYKNPPPAALENRSLLREWELPISVVETNQMIQMTDMDARGTGDDPYIVYALPEPAFVRGIRVTFVLTTPQDKNALMRAFWMQTGRTEFSGDRMHTRFNVQAKPEAQTIMFRVDDTIDRFRIDPHEGPCDFRLLGITVISQ